MALQKPESMDDLVYFTQRDIEGKGEIMVWVLRQDCPKCGKEKMGKPRNSKGKVMTRAKEYACATCGHTAPKQVYEDKLMASAEYTCGACGKHAETQVPFKRKLIEGIPTLRVTCAGCGAHIDVTKKLKEKRNK